MKLMEPNMIVKYQTKPNKKQTTTKTYEMTPNEFLLCSYGCLFQSSSEWLLMVAGGFRHRGPKADTVWKESQLEVFMRSLQLEPG